ncbi:MAG: gephyrin-like molybdotransferase Glp [Planctomycetaceae bacterium]
MIELAAAIAAVERTAAPLPLRRHRLLEAAGGRLAEPVMADVDSPPWDRAMMDGFAVRSADVVGREGDVVVLDVVADLAAGVVTGRPIASGCCARIMTGAPLPPGADAVVPVEAAVDGTAGAHAGGRVRFRDPRFRAGQHVGLRGAAFAAGSIVLPPGAVLTPAAVGLAAEAGATHVVAAARPRVAILSTGSELVPAGVAPGPGQTRNSNGPMIAAAVTACGGEPVPLGIAADRPEAIRAAVMQGLAADVLVLSGGVSAGDLDLVPSVLEACGVREVFHKVRLKPGKPVWFGTLARAAGRSPALVFGLPGNPASSLVCFELFVRPALAILAGRPRHEWHLPRSRGVLTAAAKSAADRPVYLPCRLERTAARIDVTPLPWTGSSDLVGLAVADGLVALPAGATADVGSDVEVLSFAGGAASARDA